MWFADTHGGSKYGLCNPDTWLEDEDREPYHPTLTTGQRLYWDWYLEGIEWVLSITGSRPLHIYHGGDICQGNTHPEDNMSLRIADHIAIGAANMAPMLALPNAKSLTLLAGTAAHDFGAGSAERGVANILGKHVEMGYHDLVDFGDVTVDAAHHGPGTGLRSWLHGNTLRYYMRSCLYNDDPAADIYLRAHVHDSAWEFLYHEHKRHHLFVCPSWQLPGAYVRQRGQSPSAVVAGFWLLEFDRDRLADAHEYHRTFPLRRRVTL